MSTFENATVTVIVLLAPVGLVYGWYFYFVTMSKEPLGWRKWVTVADLGLLSVAMVMWPVARVTAPEVNWQTWAGAGTYMHWVDAWERAALRILLAALALSLFARPRLIVPMVVASVGIGLFWIFSNIL
jgi:hypothetical protein